ncbi:type II secretion system inner membrane protein GspF [Chitinibacteraceae bacterium HSL-7]
MPAFRYRAVRQDGIAVSGLVDADSPRSARSQLLESGIWVSELAPAAERVRKARRMSTSRLALWTRQLATLLDAGLPLSSALAVLGAEAEHVAEQNMTAAIRSEIAAGASLSRALESQRGLFPELYRTIVAAGEESGRAPAVLARLADYLESRAALNAKVALAFVYPIVVTVVSVLVVLGLLTWVVPQMVSVFESAKQELPLLTRALLWASAGVRSWGAPVLLIGALAAFIGWRSLRKPAVRLRFDAFCLRIPLFGRLILAANTARLAATLAMLVGSGVPLLRALSAVAGVTTSAPLRAAVESAARDVREGAALSRALAATRAYPPVLVHLIASGEATGRLEYVLDKAASQQAQELENRVSTLTGLLGPLMVLAMGGVVMLIVLAILLPVFEMNQLVR